MTKHSLLIAKIPESAYANIPVSFRYLDENESTLHRTGKLSRRQERIENLSVSVQTLNKWGYMP